MFAFGADPSLMPEIYFNDRPIGTNVIEIVGATPITDGSKKEGFSRDLQQVAAKIGTKLGDKYSVQFEVKMCKGGLPGVPDQLRGVIVIKPNS